MKRDFVVASVLAITALTGCSSKPKDMGQPFTQDKSKSVALNVAAYAGYPYVLRDNSYDKSLDTLVSSSSNALLMANDLSGSLGSLGGGALGLGLGFISGMAAQYPLDAGKVFTAKLQPGEDYKSAATVLRVIKDNYQKREVDAADGEKLRGLLAKTTFADYVCEPTTVKDYDFSCFDPADDRYNTYVKATRPANGLEFAEVMPLAKGNYGVFFIRNDRGSVLTPRKDATDAYFHLKDGSYVLGNTNTVLPRVAPREDGKRLVFLNGKATLI